MKHQRLRVGGSALGLGAGLLLLAGRAVAASLHEATDAPASRVTPVLTDKDLWAVLAAFGTVWLVALINQATWADDLRWLVYFAVAVIAGTVNAVLNGTIDAHTGWVRSVLLVCVAGIIFYHGQRDAIRAFELRTTRPPGPPTPPPAS